LIPNPGTPFPTLGIGCFTPLPGSGWQVLFNSQHGLIGSEKLDTLQKMVAGQPEPDPQKKTILTSIAHEVTPIYWHNDRLLTREFMF
jgi:hypothetical protein